LQYLLKGLYFPKGFLLDPENKRIRNKILENVLVSK